MRLTLHTKGGVISSLYEGQLVTLAQVQVEETQQLAEREHRWNIVKYWFRLSIVGLHGSKGGNMMQYVAISKRTLLCRCLPIFEFTRNQITMNQQWARCWGLHPLGRCSFPRCSHVQDQDQSTKMETWECLRVQLFPAEGLGKQGIGCQVPHTLEHMWTFRGSVGVIELPALPFYSSMILNVNTEFAILALLDVHSKTFK